MPVSYSSSELSSSKLSMLIFHQFRSSPSIISSLSPASIIALSAVGNSLFFLLFLLFMGRSSLMCPFLLQMKHDIPLFHAYGSTSPSSPYYMNVTSSLSDMRFTPFLVYSNFILCVSRRRTARSPPGNTQNKV